MTKSLYGYNYISHFIFLGLIFIIFSSNLYAQNLNMYFMNKDEEFTKAIKLSELNKKMGIKVFSFYDAKCKACFEDLRIISLSIKRKQENIEFYGFQTDIESNQKSESIVDREKRYKDFLSAISKYGMITKSLLPKPILVSSSPQAKTKLLDLFSEEFKINLQSLTTQSYPFHVICDESKSCKIFNQENDFTISNDYDTMNDFFKLTTSFSNSENQNILKDKNQNKFEVIKTKLQIYILALVGIIALILIIILSKSKHP